ncbi:MAG: Fe-S cluster assembly protein HesB, partial [Candidatus Eremiobacteraeota bacterium]|nr:Fe-S cluster assembly protein HesB [Candidatus Eremiobacteraeota bacterium]
SLPPARLQEAPFEYYRTFRSGTGVVEVRMRERRGALVADSPSALPRGDRARIERAVARMFRLGDDLSAFYARIAADAQLGWAAAGAGRLLSSPTVFEDVVKTICTTNCAWSATIRMTAALVERGGGTFPEPGVLAETPERWYSDVARMGYRGPYVREIARRVSVGELDLESLLPVRGRSDDDVESALLALPGVGPYAAAHIMQLLGRYHRLVLDSWTRPTYLRLSKRKRATDATIRRDFARYGEYAGLAFWLFVTRDWVEDNRASG